MAIDYGFWSTLSTGYKTAQDRKSTRDAESMKELQYMQMLQQQQAQRIDQQNRVQQELDNASQVATQLLNSSFGRQKDIDDMKKWHSEHSGWGDIKNIIQQHNGDYTQARLYGNLDYYINQYKMNINNPDADPTKGNPILRRVANNKSNLTNFTLAQQSTETQGLVMPGDIDRYKAFINGDTDEFDYRGIRGDWDISTMMQDTDAGQEISFEDFYAKNTMAILSDMSKDTGIDVASLQENPSAVEIWTKQAMRWDEAPVYGEKEIETSYVNQFQKNIDALPSIFSEYKGSTESFTVNDVFDMDKDHGSDGEGKSGFQRLLESTNPEDGSSYSDLWTMIGGYDSESSSNSKLGGTNVIAGHQLNSSSRILTDKPVQTAVLKAHYGENYLADDGMINNLLVKGLYSEDGALVTDDDISGTWLERGVEVGAAAGTGGLAVGAITGPGAAIVGGLSAVGGFGVGALGFNPFGEGEEMDLKYNGTYLGFRVRGVDPSTGQPTTMLITRDTDESDIKKAREQYGNLPVEVVMINELIDSDTFSSDDMYYDVIDLKNISFRQQMEETTDSESLSKVYNESTSYKTKKKNAGFYEERKAKLTQGLANIYTEGNTEILPQVATSYKSNIETSLVVGGVSAENGHLTSPMIMSWLLTESEKAGNGDMAKTNKNFEAMTSGLSGLIKNDPVLKEALQGGPKGFLKWYGQNTDKETFKKFKSSNKQWSKYFTLNK